MKPASTEGFSVYVTEMMRPEPMEQTLARLRHAYLQLINGAVKDQLAFADGLIAPVIRSLELRAAEMDDKE